MKCVLLKTITNKTSGVDEETPAHIYKEVLQITFYNRTMCCMDPERVLDAVYLDPSKMSDALSHSLHWANRQITDQIFGL